MTDRIPPDESGDQFETRVREAFARAEPPRAPDALRVHATELAARVDQRRDVLSQGIVPMAFAALAIVVSVGLATTFFTPGGDSTTKGEDVAPVSPVPNPVPCAVSPVEVEGQREEIGEGRAFFDASTVPTAAAAYPWKVVVRFDPDLRPSEAARVYAQRVNGRRFEAEYNGPLGTPGPGESGRHLFIQPVTMPGCWRLSAEIDGIVVGSALIDVGSGSGSVRSGAYTTGSRQLGLPCFAFEVNQARFAAPTEVQGWQLPADADGACLEDRSGWETTRTVIQPIGGPGHELLMELTDADGMIELTRITLYSSECCLSGVVNTARDEAVFFTEIP